MRDLEPSESRFESKKRKMLNTDPDLPKLAAYRMSCFHPVKRHTTQRQYSILS
jgi:hypothetical protein